MRQNSTAEARARRGAGHEPKRKRARGARCQPHDIKQRSCLGRDEIATATNCVVSTD